MLEIVIKLRLLEVGVLAVTERAVLPATPVVYFVFLIEYVRKTAACRYAYCFRMLPQFLDRDRSVVSLAIPMTQWPSGAVKDLQKSVELAASPTEGPYVTVMRQHSGMLLPTGDIHNFEVILVEEVQQLGLGMRLAAVIMAELSVLPLPEGIELAEWVKLRTRWM